jgi:hypothetical protein
VEPEKLTKSLAGASATALTTFCGALKNRANDTDWPARNWPMAHSMDVPSALALQGSPSEALNTACSAGSVTLVVPTKRNLLMVLVLLGALPTVTA